MRRRIETWIGLVAGAIIVLAPQVTLAQQTIISGGPLTAVGISGDLNCSVNHVGDSRGEFFDDTACGTLVAVGGQLFGPSFIPAGGSANPRTAFTPVAQSAVTGSGTGSNPYQIVTTVDLGSTGLRIVETDAYVVGEESYRTDVEIQNGGTSDADVTLYRAGDCFLQDSDFGFGSVDATTGAVACVGTVLDSASGSFVPGDRIEQWLPLSPNSSYQESFYADLWAQIGTQTPFGDTCSCPNLIDNGAGLSWTFSVPAGGAITRSHLTTFSPLGHLPLSTTKDADSDTVVAGAIDGYTITVTNPNAVAVTLDAVSDSLPAGFAYVAGSTQGATTADPSITGNTLTWSGSILVPGAVGANAGTVSLHFLVTVSSVAGGYFNNASAHSEDFTVAPTGDTARVVVGAPSTTTTAAPTTTIAPSTSTSSSTSSTSSTTTSSSSSSTILVTTSTTTTVEPTTTTTLLGCDAFRCGVDGAKVTICHIPPGNPGNAHTLCVGRDALSPHLQHHDDHCGPCTASAGLMRADTARRARSRRHRGTAH